MAEKLEAPVKVERQRKREGAVKDLNEVALSLAGRPKLVAVNLRAPGAAVAELYNKLLNDGRVTPAQKE